MKGLVRCALLLLLSSGLGLAGCGSKPPEPTRRVTVTGEILLPPTMGRGGKVYVRLFQTWSLHGELRHPLQLLESFAAAPGTFTHTFDYPESQGEGLTVFAWVDTDGDGMQCTMTSRKDLSGLSTVQGFPANSVTVVVSLTEPCRAPNWFYPPAPVPAPVGESVPQGV